MVTIMRFDVEGPAHWKFRFLVISSNLCLEVPDQISSVVIDLDLGTHKVTIYCLRGRTTDEREFEKSSFLTYEAKNNYDSLNIAYCDSGMF